MTERPSAPDEPKLACKVCLKEIPKSVAQSLEGPDYVHHFCGPECCSQWMEEDEGNAAPKEGGD